MIKSEFKCPCCNALFGFENTPKILKNCTHTICINCLKILKSTFLNDILRLSHRFYRNQHYKMGDKKFFNQHRYSIKTSKTWR